MTYTDLKEARQVLGLGERASLKEIKARHRELVKRHHPDSGNTNEPEMIRKVPPTVSCSTTLHLTGSLLLRLSF